MGRLRLRSTPAGDALVIHPKGGYDDRAAAFARGIADDPHHTVAVVDLPADAVATEWESVARLLSSDRYGSPRLVFGRGTREDIRTACSLIADRLGREVLAPDGDLVPTVSGGLFVPGDDGAAWLRFRPGRDPEPAAQRYPKPHWEFSAPARTRPVGAHAVAQPVPAGVWLRGTDRDPLAAHHGRTVEAAPTDPHLFLVVLGSPGTPPLSLDDVTRFWDTVLPNARPAVRFVLYGTLDAPAGHPPAQSLADALAHPVTLYDDLPPGDPGPPTESTCFPAGPAAPECSAVPPPPSIRTESGGADPTMPGNASAPDTATPVPPAIGPPPVHDPVHRHGEADATDLSEAPTVRNGPRVVRDAPPADTPEPEPATAPAQLPARSSQAAPQPAAAPAPDLVPALAHRLVSPVAPRFRLESAAPEPEIVGIDDAYVLAPAGDPVAGTESAPGGEAAVPSVSEGADAVRVQPVPRAAACALPPERGIAQERDWLRRTFNEQYNAVAGSVSRVMSESPGLRGRSRTEAADALTDLVAVRLYLSGDSRRADAAVREATAGPHIPLARCVTAGLRRLPSYRGPALLRTRLGEAERGWYREGRTATEWAFCHARTSLHPGPRGGGATDVLIWSMTARRTSSLDPDVPDRVLFLPGTAFRVLRTEGTAVLMRELSPSETAQHGRDDVAAKLDEIAVKGLEKILDALERAGTDAAARSADPPGLIVAPSAVRTEGAKS
ncbi:hypothetical protein ACWDBW_31355 [Streptomyces sp. NPDC001107]